MMNLTYSTWVPYSHACYIVSPAKVILMITVCINCMRLHHFNCLQFIIYSTYINLVPRLPCMGREIGAWYTLIAHAQFSQDYWEFGNFHKVCSITLTSTKRPDFSRMKVSLIMLCVDGKKGVIKVLTCRMCLSIPAKWCSTWLTQSFPLKFTDHLEWSNTDHYHQSYIVSVFKTAHMYLTGSINFSAVRPFSS